MWCPTFLLVLTLPALGADDKQNSPKEQAAAALKRYDEAEVGRPFLHDPDAPERTPSPPPWESSLKKLKSAEPKERDEAAAFLRELLGQALEHETSGKTPWRSTPYWGGGADVPARYLRKAFADDLAKVAPSEASLPLLRWYLEKERVPDHLEPIVQALGKLDGKQADALRMDLVTRTHPNSAVVVSMLEQLASRKTALDEKRLAELCQHHRASIRQAARKLNAKLGRKEPPAFDAKQAMRSKAVRDVMADVIVLIPDLPNAKAEFVKVTVRYFDKDNETGKVERLGWLLKHDKGLVTIYTPDAPVEAFHGGERSRSMRTFRARHGVLFWRIDATQKVEVASARVETLIEEIEKSRKDDEARPNSSERGPFTGQFAGRSYSLYATVLGACLFRTGKEAEAARVVLPSIDSRYEDRDFADAVRSDMGDEAGYAMLVAFAGDRDLAGTLALARQIDKLYPETRFHDYARKMAKELPGRMNDFKKFTLPTAAEWQKQKPKLTRPQQIDFLCERLRLLNCFQRSQPGGCYPNATQYAEPCGMELNASWGLDKGKTEVINPLTELAGRLLRYGEDEDRPKGLALTLNDVPHLSKHLRDDWFMPSVSFWRDFYPDRTLSSTRPQVAEIINDLARRDVCHIDGWDKLDAKEIDKEIARINRWAKENADKTPAQLERQALRDAVDDGTGWYPVSDRVEALVKAKDAFGYELLERFLKSEKNSPYDKSRVLHVYIAHDVDRAKALAPPFLATKHYSLRFAAALVVFRTADDGKVRDTARQLLGDALAERGAEERTAARAQEIVRAFGHDEAVAEIARKDARAADQVMPLRAWLAARPKRK